MGTTVREYTPADGAAVWALRVQAFGGAETRPGTHDELWGGELSWHGLVAEVDGEVGGFTRIRPYRQFHGGHAVPMGGVASVSVASHLRGRGVGAALMTATVPTLREFGYPVSALYPTVPRFYRRWGWERAGVLDTVDLPFSAFRALPKWAFDTVARRAGEADLAAVHQRYLEFAATVNGMLDRSTPQFRLSEITDFPVRTVLPGGHLLATPNHERGRLDISELLARDPATAAQLCAEIVSWSSVLDSVRLDVTDETLLGWLDAGSWGRTALDRKTWFLRVVDLSAAVTARGWPGAGALRECAVDLEIVDEQATWQAGRHRLVIADGTVRLERGGLGLVRMHANALGPWFAGGASVAELRRAGLITGDTGDDALLTMLTATGPTPRMADYF